MTEDRVQKIERVLSQRTDFITVCIEDVYQLHNTSAVMRSCEVFGVQSLHVISQKYGKKIDTEIAMGAQKWVDIYRYDQTSEAINALKQKGYKIIATTPDKKTDSLSTFPLNEKIALFFGTERHGLSEEVISQADDFLHIPMVGFTESLNISVSAAIILQQLTERLRASEYDWKFSEEEIFMKKISWYENSIKNIDSIKKVYLNQHS
jgi:tRNA (guanosine-2'-O-)-methyltransferase